MIILIASHRRSGTHLTIDSLINNFPALYDCEVFNLDRIFEKHEMYMPAADIRSMLKQHPNILLKTHLLPTVDIYDLPNEARDLVKELMENHPIIYAYRNGLDVMVSLYHYVSTYDDAVRQLTFQEFVRQNNTHDPEPVCDRLSFWSHHTHSWINGPYHHHLLPVSFEKWLTDYDSQLSEVGQFLRLPLRKRSVNVSLSSQNTLFRRLKRKIAALTGRTGDGIRNTAVMPRKGKAREWQQFYTPEAIADIPESTKSWLAKLDYPVR